MLASLLRVFLFVSLIGLVYGLAVFRLGRGLVRLAGRTLKRSWLDGPRVGIPVLALAAVGLLCMLYGWFIEPTWLQVTRHEVRRAAVPPGRSFRIVQLSDFHLEGESSRERRLPDLVNALRPDLIVLTGDYFNEPGHEGVLLNLLARFEQRQIYAVPGNWDEYIVKSVDLKGLFRKAGVRLLWNEFVELTINDVPIHLVGMKCFDAACLSQLARLPRDELKIVLQHAPSLIPRAARAGADIFLCGHTHGGQVRLPFYGALITLSRYGKRFEAGAYQEGKMWAYVNRGLGMEGGIAPRVRFLCRPEIAVIDVRSIHESPGPDER